MIGATETCIRFYLLDKIKRFTASHPDIHITFRGSTTPDLCRMIESDDMDIGFVISPLPEGYNFDLIHLRDFQDVPVVSTCLGLDPDRVYTPEYVATNPHTPFSEAGRQFMELLKENTADKL